MSQNYKVSNFFVSQTASPRIDGIKIIAHLTKDSCTNWFYGEYDYTGEETAHLHKYSHDKNVDSWELEVIKYRVPQVNCEITMQQGNHVEFKCQVINQKKCLGLGQWLNFPWVIDQPITLYATMNQDAYNEQFKRKPSHPAARERSKPGFTPQPIPEPSIPNPPLPGLVKSKRSKVYHKTFCGYALRLKYPEPVYSLDGLRPCKRCRNTERRKTHSRT